MINDSNCQRTDLPSLRSLLNSSSSSSSPSANGAAGNSNLQWTMSSSSIISPTTTSRFPTEEGDRRRTRLLSILESACAISAPTPAAHEIQHDQQNHRSRGHLLHVLERASIASTSATVEEHNDRHRASLGGQRRALPARTSGTAAGRRSGADAHDGYRLQ